MTKKGPFPSEYFRLETQTKLFTQVVGHLDPTVPDYVADYGCGYGRHSLPLAISGHKVVAIDNDFRRLAYIQQNKSRYLNWLNISSINGSIKLVQCDLISNQPPFGNNKLAGAVCIHFPDYEIIKRIIPTIRRNGFLLFETFDGHGKNYEQLPESGYLKNIVESDFNIQHYNETPVKPFSLNRATVRIFGFKNK